MKMTIAGASWLQDATLQQLLAALSAGGEEARVAGGAVRNALLGQPVTDIDIATTTEPSETMDRAEKAGFRTVPTGIEHGTVTVVADGRAFEVTTLRADVETDGRHAKVVFGRDWKADAERRDFTINALYATADGTIVDLVGGMADIEARRLRFIGSAEERIREDYLRILRFFRFFAWYGEGRPDAEGLKACVRLKQHMAGLSAERVWSELKKLLAAPDPSRALLWMRQSGVLTAILPESERWGIDTIHPLVESEAAFAWASDPLLRLEAIVPPAAERVKSLSKRLKLSKNDSRRLEFWTQTTLPDSGLSSEAFKKVLYRSERTALSDRLRLAIASARLRARQDDQALVESGRYVRFLDLLENWERPGFPLSGDDLKVLGLKTGKRIGTVLTALEDEWIESGFAMERDALLQRAARKIND